MKVEPQLPSQPIIDESNLEKRIHHQGCQVNLFYFDKSYECFSKWQKDDLKKFSKWLDKMRNCDINDLKARAHAHIGKTKNPPHNINLSPDEKIYSIAIQGGGSLRIHGIFERNTFFVFWLDRNHKICS